MINQPNPAPKDPPPVWPKEHYEKTLEQMTRKAYLDLETKEAEELVVEMLASALTANAMMQAEVRRLRGEVMELRHMGGQLTALAKSADAKISALFRRFNQDHV